MMNARKLGRPSLPLALRLRLERWFLSWALRVESRWTAADLRSRYY